jgi:chromate transporter
MMVYLQLFWAFFKIGLFGFGGGAAMIPLIQFELVEHYEWVTSAEFTNMVAISQMTPGPIGINCATYAGYLASGNVFGSALATFALVLPSFIIMMIVARMIQKMKDNPYMEAAMRGLRPAIVGLIAAAALLLVNEETFGENCADWVSWLLFAVSFVATKWLKVHPILLILIMAGVGAIIY